LLGLPLISYATGDSSCNLQHDPRSLYGRLHIAHATAYIDKVKNLLLLVLKASLAH